MYHRPHTDWQALKALRRLAGAPEPEPPQRLDDLNRLVQVVCMGCPPSERYPTLRFAASIFPVARSVFPSARCRKCGKVGQWVELGSLVTQREW